MNQAQPQLSALPRLMTSFIGRQEEIASILALLNREDVRLVTLTGPGGIGKTRLSIEIAHRMDLDPEWAVRFVTLAPIESVDDALRLIAGAIGLWDSQPADTVSRMANLLQGEPLLLVIDNLEHVIDIAGQLGELLGMTSGLKILATSRSPLHIQGEREYSVPQLTVPQPANDRKQSPSKYSEAVELFVDRARSINHQFTTDDKEIGSIVEICSRLDGLPLAIELAAARTRALPPAALLARLDNQLGVLRSDARDVPQRLRTIRATIDWSYRLLSAEEQEALRYLSAFAGDFSLSGASAILELDDISALDMLESLIDKSLLLSRGALHDEPHFRMLTVVREFGNELLQAADEVGAVRERQAEWAASLCEDLFEEQLTANQHIVFQRIGRIHESIRQALVWSIANERWDYAARIAANLWQYWDISGNLGQGRRWLHAIIQQDIVWPDELIPKLFYGFAILARSVEDAHENERIGRWLLETYSGSPDIRIRATGLNMIALCRQREDALAAALEASELWKDAGETIWHGLAIGLAGRWARELGDLDLSETCSQRSFEVLTAAGHLWGASLALQGIGRVHHLRGDIERANAIYRDGLAELSMIGDRILVLRYFEFLIEIAAHYEQWERAIRLSGAAGRMRELMSYELRYSAEAAASRKLHDEARKRMGDEWFQKEWESGKRMTLADSVAYALEELETSVSSAVQSSPGPVSLLTPRELEVLTLIVSGKTDQAIADELFVSYRTVTTHVTNILNKLGADSRTEAAAIAVRQHLVED
jgi:predicted ATPase/DNA-binding CsgD family transcriptional regulator